MHALDIGDGAGTGPKAANASGAVWMASSVAALGGFLFGYDWVVIGGAKPFYEASFAITAPADQAWAVACALVGCLIGAICSGYWAERLGRKPALLIAAVIFAVSSLATAVAHDYSSFVLYRIIGGVAIGMASGLSPMYIAEIAPASSRGRLVCLNQIAIVLGLLGAQIVNWLIARPVPADATMVEIAQSWNGEWGWRWMFAAAAVPSVAFLLGCLLLPESPRWLVQRGRINQARAILTRLGGAEHAESAISDIQRSIGSNAGGNLRSVLREPRYRRVLVIGVALAVLQQWSGINVIFNYAQEIFASAGFAVSDTLFNIVITGVVNCVFTLIALFTVEGIGRRRLMLIGCAGLGIIYALLGGFYVVGMQSVVLMPLVLAAIACYAMTLAPVTWVALAEIFPGEARGACMAVATTSLWLACFVLTYTFPLLNAAAGTGLTFWLYGVICLAGFVFIYRNLPETKGKTLEEIEKVWK